MFRAAARQQTRYAGLHVDFRLGAGELVLPARNADVADEPGDTAATILKRADEALYRAKRDGRNRVVPDAA